MFLSAGSSQYKFVVKNNDFKPVQLKQSLIFRRSSGVQCKGQYLLKYPSPMLTLEKLFLYASWQLRQDTWCSNRPLA